MIAASGSRLIVKLTLNLPAANHVAGCERNWRFGSSATRACNTNARTAAVAQARTRGQLAVVRSDDFERSAPRIAAASGKARMRSARLSGSDTASLLRGQLRTHPGGLELPVGGFWFRLRQQLGIHDRRHPEFAQRL